MGKIDDILLEINQFLNSADQTDNPQIRKAVNLYTQACREVSEKLEECRKLIKSDLAMDARRINAEMTPPLTERAAKLSMRGEKYEKLTQFCKYYKYDLPPLIDMDALKLLRESNGDSAMNSLIIRWRKIGRTHDHQAKMDLLREILASQPADETMWRNNLINVEQKFITETIAEAETAVREGQNRKVIHLIESLKNQPFLIAPDEAELQKFTPVIQATLQAEFDAELEAKRNELFSAYSIMDCAMIKPLLAEYDEKTRNKLYRKDIQAERAVDEIRNFLLDSEKKQQQDTEFKENIKKLTAELDQHGDFELIENLYNKLVHLDLPIDERITLRFKNRREEFNAEQERKHKRKCIYSVLGVLLLIGLCVLAFSVIQNYRTYQHYNREMTALLEKNNFDGVIKLHDQIQSQSPILLRFGHLTAIKAEAELLKKQRLDNLAKLQDVLDIAGKELDQQQPSLENLRKLNEEIAKLRSDDMPPEIAADCRDFDDQFASLELKHKDQQEQMFIEAFRGKTDKLEKYARMLEDPTSDLARLDSLINSELSAAQQLLQNSQHIDKKLLESQTNLLDSMRQTLQQKITATKIRRHISNNLYRPATANDYLRTLKDLDVNATDLARADWAYAVSMNQTYKNLIASTRINGDVSNHNELKSCVDNLEIATEKNIFINDWLKLLPDVNFGNNVKNYSNILKRMLDEYDCYELIVSDENNILWYFYSTEKPEIKVSSYTGEIKEIRMKVLMNQRQESPLWGIQLHNYTRQYEVSSSLSIDSMPRFFTSLHQVPKYKAAHYQLIESILQDLQRVNTPEKLEAVLMKYLAVLLTNENKKPLNALVRANLVKELFKMLPGSSSFYTYYVLHLNSQLESIVGSDFANWHNPSFTCDNQSKLKELNKFFSSINLQHLQDNNKSFRNFYKLSLNRALQPAGLIIRKSKDAPAEVHLFNNVPAFTEMWFYIPAQDDKAAHWYVISANLITQDKKMRDNLLRPENGTMFFTPTDNNDTLELAKAFKESLSNMQFIPENWPASWPLNKK